MAFGRARLRRAKRRVEFGLERLRVGELAPPTVLGLDRPLAPGPVEAGCLRMVSGEDVCNGGALLTGVAGLLARGCDERVWARLERIAVGVTESPWSCGAAPQLVGRAGDEGCESCVELAMLVAREPVLPGEAPS